MKIFRCSNCGYIREVYIHLLSPFMTIKCPECKKETFKLEDEETDEKQD